MNAGGVINVLLVDDSVLVRTMLKDIFASTPDIKVIGEAGNGKDAVEMTKLLQPGLVIIDLLMPVMGGLTAIEAIMAETPTPILVLSATVDEREVTGAFDAIRKGALDVMEKPPSAELESSGGFSARLLEKVRLLARIKVIRRWQRHKPTVAEPAFPAGLPLCPSILAIGASTGGPKGVMKILKALPRDFPGTAFVVQHIASGFALGFSQWLSSECKIPVRLVADGDTFTAGEALIAPNDRHMILEGNRLRLVDLPPVNCCRPSIDVFFNSVAALRAHDTVAILLSGMGRDGAQGLLAIKKSGGVTLVQDEDTCAVFGMPKAAISINAAAEILPLPDIPPAINRLFGC